MATFIFSSALRPLPLALIANLAIRVFGKMSEIMFQWNKFGGLGARHKDRRWRFNRRSVGVPPPALSFPGVAKESPPAASGLTTSSVGPL